MQCHLFVPCSTLEADAWGLFSVVVVKTPRAVPRWQVASNNPQSLAAGVRRYRDGHMDVTRLSAAAEFASAGDFAAAASAAGTDDALGCDSRTGEGGRCVTLSRS